jgi:hypothetical protein
MMKPKTFYGADPKYANMVRAAVRRRWQTAIVLAVLATA